MKKFIKENWFKLIISLVIVAFVYLPYKRNHDFNRCLNNSENKFSQQQRELNNQIDVLGKSRQEAQSEADSRLKEFLKNNPEPKAKVRTPSVVSWDWDFLNADSKWQKDKGSIFDSVNNFNHQIDDLEKKRDNAIVVEKKADDEACYKRYK